MLGHVQSIIASDAEMPVLEAIQYLSNKFSRDYSEEAIEKLLINGKIDGFKQQGEIVLIRSTVETYQRGAKTGRIYRGKAGNA